MAIAMSIETGKRPDISTQKDSQSRRPFVPAGGDRGSSTVSFTGRPSFDARINPRINRTRAEIRMMFR